MNRIIRAALPLLLLSALLTACAVRLGGGGPQAYTAIALKATGDTGAADVGQRLRAAGADVVLLSSERDSAWFAEVATSAGLELSGPGETSGRGFAFLSRLEVLGDTSLVLNVDGGGSVHMHDALYRVTGGRYLNLMMVRLDAPDLRAAVRALLLYVASDVMANAAVLLAVDAATPALADSAAILMRAHYTPAVECADDGGELAAAGSIRLLYGPVARLTCRSARLLPGAPPAIQADVVVER
jgi:hypothetical protein